MKTTTDYHKQSLAALIGCAVDDLSERSFDHYGLSVYEIGSSEYAIGTDEEAQSAAEQAISDSAWAFNAEFICAQCNLPSELADAIRSWQEKECEGCNDAIVELIESHCPGGMTGSHSFSDDAIRSDGRGHFLSSYDSEETEVDGEDEDGPVTLYVYRLN